MMGRKNISLESLLNNRRIVGYIINEARKSKSSLCHEYNEKCYSKEYHCENPYSLNTDLLGNIQDLCNRYNSEPDRRKRGRIRKCIIYLITYDARHVFSYAHRRMDLITERLKEKR